MICFLFLQKSRFRNRFDQLMCVHLTGSAGTAEVVFGMPLMEAFSSGVQTRQGTCPPMLGAQNLPKVQPQQPGSLWMQGSSGKGYYTHASLPWRIKLLKACQLLGVLSSSSNKQGSPDWLPDVGAELRPGIRGQGQCLGVHCPGLSLGPAVQCGHMG